MIQLSCWMLCFCVRFAPIYLILGADIVNITEKVIKIAQEARQASLVMARTSTAAKNDMLLKMAGALEKATPLLIAENRKDLADG
jgi:hypothetical protein